MMSLSQMNFKQGVISKEENLMMKIKIPIKLGIVTITQVSIEVLHVVNVTVYNMYIMKSHYLRRTCQGRTIIYLLKI